MENKEGDYQRADVIDVGPLRLDHGNHHGQGHEFLRKATEIKNIWVPYGE